MYNSPEECLHDYLSISRPLKFILVLPFPFGRVANLGEPKSVLVQTSVGPVELLTGLRKHILPFCSCDVDSEKKDELSVRLRKVGKLLNMNEPGKKQSPIPNFLDNPVDFCRSYMVIHT